jgi:hypothetical protein
MWYLVQLSVWLRAQVVRRVISQTVAGTWRRSLTMSCVFSAHVTLAEVPMCSTTPQSSLLLLQRLEETLQSWLLLGILFLRYPQENIWGKWLVAVLLFITGGSTSSLVGDTDSIKLFKNVLTCSPPTHTHTHTHTHAGIVAQTTKTWCIDLSINAMRTRTMYGMILGYLRWNLMMAKSAKTCSFYLFLNVNQLDALNFITSLFQASTCFEHMCSSSGGQNCPLSTCAPDGHL